MQKRLKIKLHEAKDLPRDEDFARDDKEDQNDSLPNTSISIYVTEKYINRPKTLQGIFISLEIIINHDILQLNNKYPIPGKVNTIQIFLAFMTVQCVALKYFLSITYLMIQSVTSLISYDLVSK